MSPVEKRARLQRALDYGGNTHSIDDVVSLVQQNKARFYQYNDGFIVAEMERWPQKTAVRFWLIAGALGDCLALEDEVLADGIAEGATVAVASGRRGWGRVAAPTGWRLHGYQFFKPLGDAP